MIRKYKVENLYIANITDGIYEKRIDVYAPLTNSISIVTKKIVKEKSIYCDIIYNRNIKYLPDCNYIEYYKYHKTYIMKLTPLFLLLKDKSVKKVTREDILYFYDQLNRDNFDSFNGLELKNKNLKINDTSNVTVSKPFFIEMEKVISELDTSLSEDIKNMYSSKISEIGENYIKDLVKNYKEIKLNPSIELDILHKYIEELTILEEEIIKSNYENSLLNELNNVKQKIK